MSSRFAFSSAVYCRNDGAVLLVHHKGLDCWLPVGGEIEPGESPLAAAVRELREETGLAPHKWPWHSDWDSHWTVLRTDGTPSGYLGYEEYEAGSNGIHGTFSFLFDVNSRDVKLCDEHHAFEWVDGWASELAERYPMPPNVQRYLATIRHTGARAGGDGERRPKAAMAQGARAPKDSDFERPATCPHGYTYPEDCDRCEPAPKADELCAK